MQAIIESRKPSKDEQALAMKSYSALAAQLEQLKSNTPEIEIEETEEKIKLPLHALKLLGTIVKAISEGKAVAILATASEVTTQVAAELLGCSRPHVVKLLESGEIPFTKVGRHRRVKYTDINEYKKQMKARQKALIIEIMKGDEELGMYDT